MGLTGKLESEVEIKAPANEYFHNLIDHAALYPTVVPHDSHRSEVHEGDGKTVGSVMSLHFVLEEEDTAKNCKGKIEAIDEENKSITVSYYDGDLGKHYKKYQLNVQVVTTDGKNFVKWCVEYEKVNDEVPDPVKYMNFHEKFYRGLDAHVLKA